MKGTTLQALEAAHYPIVSVLFGCETVPDPLGLLTRTPLISDPEWNHLRVQAHPLPPVREVTERAREVFRESGRRVTVTLSSRQLGTETRGTLEALGWAPSYRHSWLLFGRERVAEPELPPGVEIVEVDEPLNLNTFLELFQAVFTPEDPAAGEEYRKALATSPDRAAPHTLIHYLAFCDGDPAGTASVVHAGGVAGGFNLGVLPRFRGRGIGRALTLRRLFDALHAGNRLVYLITEDPAVEKSQIRRGHIRILETEGWTVPGPPSSASG